MAEDADAVDVDPLVARRELLDAGLLIGKAVVAHVEVAEVLIGVGTVGASAAVAELDDDEAEIGEALRNARRAERVGDALGLRSRIDVGDDRILLRRVEIEGLVHIAPDVGDSVGCLDHERL